MTRSSHCQTQRKRDWGNSITWVKFRLIFTHVMLFYQLRHRLSLSLSVFPLFCLSLCFWIKMIHRPSTVKMIWYIEQSPQIQKFLVSFLLFLVWLDIYPLKIRKEIQLPFLLGAFMSSQHTAGLSINWTGLQKTFVFKQFFPAVVANGQRMCKTRIGSGQKRAVA